MRTLRLLAIALAASAAADAAAQSGSEVPLPPPPPAPKTFQLAALAGWRITSDLGTDAGTITADGAPSYGLAVDLGAAWDAKVEILWSYSATTARFLSTSAAVESTRDFDLAVHYFQIGGLRYFGNARARPFAAASIGAAWIIPGDVTFVSDVLADASSLWRFAFTVGGGVDFSITPHLAIRAQGRLQAPVYMSSATVLSGPLGTTVSVNAGLPVLQGDFTAGLVFRP
jgi:opacity protein-like surface antigen